MTCIKFRFRFSDHHCISIFSFPKWLFPFLQESEDNSASEIEKFVWSNQKPWIPHPLLSMHVRMGDKSCEMKVVGFNEYMHLAERIRKRFPHLSSIWLSTEMQVISVLNSLKLGINGLRMYG